MKAFHICRYTQMNKFPTIPEETPIAAAKRSGLFDDIEELRELRADGLRAVILVGTKWEDGKKKELAVGSVGWLD